MRDRHRIPALALVLGLGLVTAAVAAEQRVSGTIVELDPSAHTLVVEEAAAAKGSEPMIVKRTITVTPDTVVELDRREDTAKGGDWPGGFRAAPLTVTDLKPRDFATVTVEERDGRLVARRVSVVRP